MRWCGVSHRSQCNSTTDYLPMTLTIWGTCLVLLIGASSVRKYLLDAAVIGSCCWCEIRPREYTLAAVFSFACWISLMIETTTGLPVQASQSVISMLQETPSQSNRRVLPDGSDLIISLGTFAVTVGAGLVSYWKQRFCFGLGLKVSWQKNQPICQYNSMQNIAKTWLVVALACCK